MTSTAWQRAALEGIIQLWAAMIAEVFGIIVGIILANAGNVRNILHKLGAEAFAYMPSPTFIREARLRSLSARVSASSPCAGSCKSIAMAPPHACALPISRTSATKGKFMP